ncbi:Uncharacterised protein [Mycobacterium tuberculosis]|nr:Uncharacterised protein [Mycobacterium tuberculosis]
MPYSSFGRPATAFSATLGITVSRNFHMSEPSALCTSRGASSMYFFDRWFLNMSGGSTVWSSTLISIMSSLFMTVSSQESAPETVGSRRRPEARFLENYLLAK